MKENRQTPRQRTFKGGKISREGFSVLDCVVRNISATGACVEVVSQKSVPDEFELVVTKDNSIRRCRVVWRAGNRIGVQFFHPEPASTVH